MYHTPNTEGRTDASSGELDSRDLLTKVHNALQRDVELSFQTVVASMAGFPERYRSHTYHNLIMAPFLQWLAESGLEDCPDQQSSSTGGDSLLVSDVKGQFTLSNQRMDYTFRPDGLDNCSLYDFVGCWEKQLLGKTQTYYDWTQEDIDCSLEASTPFDMLRRTAKQAQLRFQNGHNQHATHGLAFHIDHEQHIVIVKGPTFPSRNKSPSQFAKMILVLFKPFRDVRELCGTNSWEEALEQFESVASDRVKFYIQNIEELRNRQIAWEEDVVLRTKVDNIPSDADIDFEPFQDDRELSDTQTRTTDSDSDIEMDSDSDNSLAWMSTGRNATKLDQAYNVAHKQNLFASRASDCVTAHNPADGLDTRRTSANGTLPWVRQLRRSEHSKLAEWRSELKLLRDINIKKMMGLESKSAEPRTALRSELPPKPAVLQMAVEQSNENVATQFSLNHKQRKAFMLVANTLSAEIDNVALPADNKTIIHQLRMYVGGPGGSGKTRIVDALKYLFNQRGKLSWLQCSAPTGTAAKSIKGRTFYSLLGIDPKVKSKQQYEDRKLKGAKRDQTATDTKHLKFLIIDEISMISCSVLQEISSQLISIRGADPNCDFGGVHVIFFGDFHQLHPCSGIPLYNSSAEKADWNETIQGRLLWKRVNQVIMLTEQHRQIDDPNFGQLLERIRHAKTTCCCQGKHHMHLSSQCTQTNTCDYHVLLARVVTADDAKKIREDPDWNRCKIVVPQNLIRQAWNIDDAVSFAMQSKQPLLICTARDRRTKSQPVSRSDHKRISLLKDSQTAALPYRLPLVVGMRVMLRYNLATELGLTNGAEGTITEVVLHPSESIPQALFDEAALGEHPVIYDLRYQPSRVIVEFDQLDLPRPFPGMHKLNQVPVQPLSLGFRWTHPTKKGTEKAKPWNLSRTQFPLIPTRAFTIHMAQGHTFDKFVADIHKDTTSTRHTANGVYVALSRGRKLCNLHILQWFHHSVLHGRLDLQLKCENQRLLALEIRTLQQYKAQFGHEPGDELYESRPQPTLTRTSARQAGTNCLVILVQCIDFQD